MSVFPAKWRGRQRDEPSVSLSHLDFDDAPVDTKAAAINER
jgi:hypothetical protein